MPPVILMYHSVRDSKRDPFALRVAPAHFEEHMAIVAKTARPVTLQEIVRRDCPPRSVAVTFDDGYADNLHAALPILERHGIPATVFITTGFIGSDREFWWDELDRLILGPGRLRLPVRLGRGASARSFGGFAASRWWPWQRRRDSWKAWELEHASARQRLFEDLRRFLKQGSVEPRELALAVLREAVLNADQHVRPTALTLAELKQLAAHPLVRIGAHTVNHPSLGWLDLASQRVEIVGSREWLERELRTEISEFAYPHGSKLPDENDYTDETVRLVREAGFTLACSTRNASVSTTDSPLELPRRHVHDWDRAGFATKLDAWLNDGS